MRIPFETLVLGAGGLLILIVVYIVWRRGVKKIYQFELIFMKAGVNQHEMIRGDSLNFTHEFDSKNFEIKSDRLYRVKPGLPTRIYFRFVGISQRFILAFQTGKEDPITSIKHKVSSRVLCEVKDSRALDKALRNEFAVPMDLKKMIIIAGIGILVVVVYLVATGQVVI